MDKFIQNIGTNFFTIEALQVYCVGRYFPGSKASFDKSQEQWYPGEPPHLEMKVYLIARDERDEKLDITKFLPHHILEKLEELFIEMLETKT